MTHDLERICPPSVYGATVWLCTCGHRSFSEEDHINHMEIEPHPLTLNTDEWVKQLDDNQREGRELERAAIVAWLRECAQRYADMYGQPVDSLPAHMYAGWIERGEHVKGTDDSSHVSGTCKEGCDDE